VAEWKSVTVTERKSATAAERESATARKYIKLQQLLKESHELQATAAEIVFETQTFERES